MSTQYRIFCSTENTFKYVWRNSPPSTCPTNESHTVSVSSISDIKKKYNKIIVSANGISDYLNITSALAANNGEHNTVFEIYPGTYIENNPLVMPPGCVVISIGTPGNVIIIGTNPDKDMFIMSPWAKIYGLLLVGNAYPGVRGVYFDGSYGGGSFAEVEDCIIQNYDIGIETVNGPDTMLIRVCLISASTNNLDKALYTHNGSSVIANSLLISGAHDGSAFFNYGVFCAGHTSKVSSTTTATYFCQNGIAVDDNAEVEITLITIGYCYHALTICPNNTNSKVRGNSFNIKESFISDINVQSQNADIIIYSGVINEAKVINPNFVTINANFQSIVNNTKYMTMTGDVKFGTPQQPTIVSVGEGRFNLVGLAVLSNTNFETGTWVNNSNSAIEKDNDYFQIFSDTAVGNCCYIGCNGPLYGVTTNIITATTANVLNTDVIWEYWDGTNWTKFNIMQSDSLPPYYCYILNSFISEIDDYQIRFGLTSVTPFATKTLNGVTCSSWVRFRLLNSIASLPTSNYIKPHCSQTQINGDGFVEHFGNARPCARLAWDYHMTTPFSMDNQSLFITKSFSKRDTYNKFTTGVYSCINFCCYLPHDIDISFPIKLKLSFVVDSDTSGNIEFIVKTTHTIIGSNIYLDQMNAPESITNQIITVCTHNVPANNSNKEIRCVMSVDIDNTFVNPRPSDGVESLLWLSVARNSTPSNTSDTFPGSVIMTAFTGTYIKWCSGDHILSF